MCTLTPNVQFLLGEKRSGLFWEGHPVDLAPGTSINKPEFVPTKFWHQILHFMVLIISAVRIAP